MTPCHAVTLKWLNREKEERECLRLDHDQRGIAQLVANDPFSMPLLNRIRRRLSVADPPERKRERKPVYIYPGVIRMSGSRAIGIDTNCPAALFSKARPNDEQANDTCSVCLDMFVSGRDIVRRLPCGHVFHSRCILSWVCTADRCPNCNDRVLKRVPRTLAPKSPTSFNEPLAEKPEDSSVRIPDLTPSTVYQLPLGEKSASGAGSASDDVSARGTNSSRVYSFVLHDQARFAELLERVFHTRWTPSL